MGKSLNNKSKQELHDTIKKLAADALKKASKKAIKKPAEATDDLVGNKIPDKIMGAASQKTSSKSTTPSQTDEAPM